MKYHNALRPDPHYRREAFDKGLQAVGLTPSDVTRCDVFLTWSRYGTRERQADQVEARGGRVLVAENATWGNDFLGRQWYSIWKGLPHLAASIRPGGPERWDALGVTPAPWRTGGTEVVGLAQRGIGPRGVASPPGLRLPGATRVRLHPGVKPAKPLEQDLADAREVVSWGSGAAVKALLWGVPVRSLLAGWAGEQDNTDAGRLAMLRRLSWAQWRLEEIESGVPFRWLLL